MGQKADEKNAMRTNASGEQSLGFLVLNNALWNGGSRLVAIILNLVTVPIFLAKLGENESG